jgi:hypothetical protein
MVLELNIGPVIPGRSSWNLERIESSNLFYLIVNQIFDLIYRIHLRLSSGTRNDLDQLSAGNMAASSVSFRRQLEKEVTAVSSYCSHAWV